MLEVADRSSWRRSRDPGTLFLRLWSVAEAWHPADRATVNCNADFRRLVAGALSRDNAVEVVGEILDRLDQWWPPAVEVDAPRSAAGLLLSILIEIDRQFLAVHPRSVWHSPAVAPMSPPLWLTELKERRLITGWYAGIDGLRLVPRGPFARHASGRDFSSGDALRHRFTALATVPETATHGGRTISIDVGVFLEDLGEGVPPRTARGSEFIAFIPVAEEKDDLVASEREDGENHFLDVSPRDPDNAADRLVEALRLVGRVDLAIAPELTVSEAEAVKVASMLHTVPEAPRMLVAGTGLTACKGPCGRPWNEGRVLNEMGAELWRQRKIWPFGMRRSAALPFGFGDPGAEGMLMEDIAANDRLTIADVDALGRCLILICQDLQTQSAVNEIIAAYEPDWVFVPILDPGVKIGGWAHQRALELSGLSQARFLVSSSLTMVRWGPVRAAPDPAFGLAIGPKEPSATPGSDAVNLARAITAVGDSRPQPPRFARLQWGYPPALWQQSVLGAADPRPAGPKPKRKKPK